MNFLSEKHWIYIGIPILFTAGSFFHCFYDLSGKNFLVGIISPVNESVWEHLQLVFAPIILWWSIYYIIKGEDIGINKERWFTAALVSLIVTMLSILFLYYFYTGAFGIESVIIDIMILLVALFIGQTFSFHIYKYFKGINIYILIIIFILLFLIIVLCTFIPPHIPLFKERKTGIYGMKRDKS